VIRFRSESDPPPTTLETATDRTTAEEALRILRDGTHLLYRGDEKSARQLFSAIKRRIGGKARRVDPSVSITDLFHRQRAQKSSEHQVLSRLLVELNGEYRLVLGHPSDVASACEAAWGKPDGEPTLVALRELLGIVGAYEWQRRGIEIPGVGRVHPHYGVFAPTRATYVTLCAEAPAPAGKRVLDVGTGTGVLACLLARRGAREVVAVDRDPRAVRCAKENVERLGLAETVEVVEGDLFAGQTAELYVANPPWLPGVARTALERAIFDPKSEFLDAYLRGLGERLAKGEGSEGWLLLSDLAERLGLRTADEVETRAARHGLAIAWTRSCKSSPNASDEATDDPILLARRDENVLLRSFVHRVS
jgi:hypothetical protein